MRLLWQRLFLPHRSLQPQATLQQSNKQDNQDVLPWSNLIDGGHISSQERKKSVPLMSSVFYLLGVEYCRLLCSSAYFCCCFCSCCLLFVDENTVVEFVDVHWGRLTIRVCAFVLSVEVNQSKGSLHGVQWLTSVCSLHGDWDLC